MTKCWTVQKIFKNEDSFVLLIMTSELSKWMKWFKNKELNISRASQEHLKSKDFGFP